MHCIYDPADEHWADWLVSDVQFGSGNQLQYFQGTPYQRGAGLADIFRSVYRLLLPLGRAAGEALGKESVQTAHRVLSHVVSGEKPREALKKGAKTGVRNLLLHAANTMKQEGEGKKKRAPRRVPLRAPGGPRLKKDIFGLY
jgi:hypothetical protein